MLQHNKTGLKGQVDRKAIRRALTERFDDAGRERVQLVSIRLNCDDRRCRKRGACQTHAAEFSYEEINEAVEWACAENAVGNVYVALASPVQDLSKKAAKSKLDLIHVAHFDFDLPKKPMTAEEREEWKDDAWELLTTDLPEGVPEGFEIVDSGGGFNLLWPLDKPLKATPENVARIEEINRRIAAAFEADGASEWNADRVLRLPGTVNWPTETKRKRGRVPALAKMHESAQSAFALKAFDGLPKAATMSAGAVRAGRKSARYDRTSFSKDWRETVYEDAVGAHQGAGKWRENPEKDGSGNLASMIWTWLYAMCQHRGQPVVSFDCKDARINLFRLVDDELRDGGEEKFPAIHWHLTKPDNVRGWEGKLSFEIDQAFNAAKREGMVPGNEISQKRADDFLARLETIYSQGKLPKNTTFEELIDEAAEHKLKGLAREKCVGIFRDMASPNTSFEAPVHGGQAIKEQLTAAERKIKDQHKAERERERQEADDGSGGDAVPLSEDWFANRFAAQNEGRYHYEAETGRWYWFTGTHWAEEKTLGVYDAIARDIRRVANTLNADEGLALGLSKGATRAAVEKMVRSDPRLVITQDAFDRDPWLLNTPGGVIDLHTGKVQAHDPSDRLNMITSVAPGGDCPLWHDFLDYATDGDREFKAYLQRVAGYFLTGDIEEHALFFLYGLGRNGVAVFWGSAIMGRPMKKRPRAPRWTGYRRDYPRRLYRALMTDEKMKPTHSALAAVLGVHSNSILKWMHKYPAMRRAVERAVYDRLEKMGVARRCLTVKFDPQTFDWDKKTLRGVVKNAKVVSRSFDHDRYEAMTAHIHMRKNLWRDTHLATVRHVILEFGPLSNYRLAEHFAVAESTLRLWRRKHPDFSRAIRDAEDEWQDRQTEQARLNTPMTWDEMRERGLIYD